MPESLAVHGGTDALGAAPHDFSTNSNACGPCPAALAAVQQADATRYPDPAYTALRVQLAAFHGVEAARIVLAGSASEFIHRVTALAARRGARAVAVPAHGYGDYAQAARAWGLAVHPAPHAGAALHWACEPSSPLGQGDAALACASAGALRVLDCAYQPLRLEGAAPLPERLEGVWQLWTPNKALGLTGVRAAYAIAPQGSGADAADLAALAPSWPVGAHGVALLQAWVQPATQQWLAGCLPRLRDWKERQIALCAALGWQVLPGSQANYFCARPPVAALPELLRDLRAQGIKLRDCASFGLPGVVRMGVLPPASQDALRVAAPGR
ncbi:aminotransferase class I/II-fold pyridoxal phosphate-dependent enzyme [Simplicispira lacusdiani]|uniref:aminotransferase class I/II-fold pyridoxal phosphate-dependent enzyme n=1 Tax=Simplicispira lacusdiani TaxID=2213010 RepID=UPI001E52B631|nr:aminotransferase class I/II-fold pyridoxal phosphate-dependent enzyme [Simplicispira lacusdiani]